MRKAPSQEEPREENETQHSEGYSLPQRRRRFTSSGHPPRAFYTDEHPEIPRIKRASRSSSMQDDQPVNSTRHSHHPKQLVNKLLIRDQTASKNKQERLQRIQTHHQKQLFPLVASFQRYTFRRKLITVGGIILIAVLLILVVVTTSHQLSANNTQKQANGKNNNIIDKSHQIANAQLQNGHPAPPVLATSAYLLDVDTGATLYASNASIHLPMLSTTKLMTALVALQIGNPNQNILINDTIANDINQLAADSSLMGIKQGETYTLKDLLYGTLLVSGNDAAVAIADQLGGGNQQNFVNKMNQEAVKLKLLDTHYVNPDGLLAPGQFSSAHDLAILAKYSLNVPLIHTISSTREYDIPKTAIHAEHQMLNSNQFLWWYPGVDGGKPGWDDATNFVQVISCIRNHHRLIGVVMHTVDWWTDMRDLMNWGFNTFDWISPHDASANEIIPYAADWHYFDKDKKETTIPTHDKGRYYIYTGYSISGLIMAYFDAHGGLNTFGFPTAQAKIFSNGDLVQQFDHGAINCHQKTKQCTKA